MATLSGTYEVHFITNLIEHCETNLIKLFFFIQTFFLIFFLLSGFLRGIFLKEPDGVYLSVNFEQCTFVPTLDSLPFVVNVTEWNLQPTLWSVFFSVLHGVYF